jgi:hypothetical protein
MDPINGSITGLAFLYRGEIGSDQSTAHGTPTNIFGDKGGHIGFSASWGAQLSALPSQGKPPQQDAIVSLPRLALCVSQRLGQSTTNAACHLIAHRRLFLS